MNNLRLVALSAIALTLGSCRSSHPDSAPRGDAPRNPGVGTAKVGGASGSTAGAPAAVPQTADARNKTARFFPTGDEHTSAVAVEKLTPGTVIVDQPFDYELRLTNLSTLTLDQVTLRETLGDGFKLLEANPKAEPGGDGRLAWRLGTLRSKESRSVRVRGSLTKAGASTSCASVEYDACLCATIEAVSPALSLSETSPTQQIRCDPIRLEYVVSNTGTGTARNVRIVDDLPEGWTTLDGMRQVVLTVGDLASRQSKALTASVKSAHAGRFEHAAKALADGGMEVVAAGSTTVLHEPMLTLVASAPEKAVAGRAVQYEFTVTNDSNGPARDVVVRDTMPAGAQNVRPSEGGIVSGNLVTWTIGSLEAKASRKLSLSLTPNGTGSVKNSVMAEAYCATAATTTSTTQIEGLPALLLELIDTPDPVELGGQVTYTITVTNQGFAPDFDISMVCEIEEQGEFVSAAGATPATHSGRKVTFAPVAQLNPKDKAEWKVVVKALAEGDTRFKITLRSKDKRERPILEEEATTFYK
jgi:uncharacterized repeat protein (TIGR01451 family)